MAFVNSTGAIGLLIIYMTQNITGSEFITYFILYLLFIMGGLLFKMPLELTFAYTLPLLLVFTVASSNFVPVLSLVAIYLAFYLAKNFIAK